MSEMEQYLTKSKKDKLMIAGAGLVLLAVGIFVMAKERNIAALIPVVMGVLCLYGGLTAGASDQKALKKLEDEGARSKAEADFASAVPVAEDHIRIGREFIFRYKYAEVLRCRDVKKFYYGEHLSSDDRPVTVGEVFLKMENGREEKLFESTGDARSEAQRVAELLLERNPDIEVEFPEQSGIIGGAVNLVKKITNKHEEE